MLRGACPQIAHSVYFGNSVLGADAIVAGDAVLVNSEDGKLYCVDGPSGKLRWAADDAGGSDASPVISNSGVRACFHAQLRARLSAVLRDAEARTHVHTTQHLAVHAHISCVFDADASVLRHVIGRVRAAAGGWLSRVVHRSRRGRPFRPPAPTSVDHLTVSTLMPSLPDSTNPSLP